jgi:hypothetical protein
MKTKIAAVILLATVLGAVIGVDAQPTPAQMAAAEAGQLSVVPADALPFAGTWWLWTHLIPVPFDLWPDMKCYDLGDGAFLLDDRGYPYSEPQSFAAQEGTNSPSLGPLLYWPEKGDAPCDCGFIWLSVQPTGSNAVLLSVHNTLPGETYAISSSTNVTLPYTNWTTETNVTGSAGDVTQGLVAMGQRSNLFFRAAYRFDYFADRHYTNAMTFGGLGFTNTGRSPPDTMGAIGGPAPGFFAELLNGDDSVPGSPVSFTVYDRTGGVAAASTGPMFFYGTPTVAADNRLLFDQHARRWVATEFQGGSSVVLKVSRSEDITDLSTNNWFRFDVQMGAFADFDTLGLDDNGLYVSSTASWSNTNSDHTVVAIKKPEIYSGTNISTVFRLTNDIGIATIQPAVNYDAVSPSRGTDASGYAWLVAKGPPDLRGTYRGGPLCYRRLHWVGTNAYLDTNWSFVTNSSSDYRDFFDYSITNLPAPQATAQGGASIDLWPNSGRLAMTSVRNGFLYTCVTVGLSGTNGTYSGDQSGINVDRSAIQWFRMGVDTASGALSYSAHGRVYDNARTTNAFYYYYGSMAANCAGDIVLGFSGSSATNNLSAFYWFRTANGGMAAAPRPIRAGLTPYKQSRIGDYTATLLDPFDDFKFWSVQQYADPAGADPMGEEPWRTAIIEIRPGP